MSRRQDEEDEDQEALVPRRPAVLGLKVADAAEEKTVQYVSYAVFGMIALFVLHFVVHVAHSGHVKHALVHLAIAAFLPALGYQAVQYRSTRLVWGFHIATIITAIFHALAFIVVLLVLIDIENSDMDVSCSSHVAPSYECPSSATGTPFGSFSDEGDQWRCSKYDGGCINAHGRCDEEPNCYDHSDEVGCPDPSTPEHIARVSQSPSKKALNREAREFCRVTKTDEKERATRLKHWWIFVSLPTYGLCCFAAYYSLEFYVQLRLSKLGVRVGAGDERGATVFERDDQSAYSRDNEVE